MEEDTFPSHPSCVPLKTHQLRLTCLHLSSAAFLSDSACSALSMAFSLSNFSICIFFLMASMVTVGSQWLFRKKNVFYLFGWKAGADEDASRKVEEEGEKPADAERRREGVRGEERRGEERRGGCKLRLGGALCDLNLTGGLETAPVSCDSPFPPFTPFHHSPPRLLYTVPPSQI